MAVATHSRTAARARELLVLATMMAVALWGILLADASSGTNRGRISGLPIGTDFVYFYTLADVGRRGAYDTLAGFEAFRAEQLRLLPDTADTPYPPVYPPQLALLLSPLARLPYGWAYVVWTIVTLAIYGVVVWRCARQCVQLRGWPAQVAMVAAASPALWFVVLHGQMSALMLAAMACSCSALRAQRPWLAGAALGLLAVKPSLFVPAVALVVAAGEWRIATGAVAGAAVLAVTTTPLVGARAVEQYVTFTLYVLRRPDLVASNLPLMHSLRTFWSGLLPSPAATLAYAATAVAVIAIGATAWRRSRSALERIGIVALVVVLASPHLFVYDLLILTPLLLASADRVVATTGAATLRTTAYLAYLVPLWGVPLAALGVQASTIALVGWLTALIRSDAADAAGQEIP